MNKIRLYLPQVYFYLKKKVLFRCQQTLLNVNKLYKISKYTVMLRVIKLFMQRKCDCKYFESKLS